MPFKSLNRHEDGTKPQQGESVITQQPIAEAKAHSSYSTTMSLLHTGVPLAAEANHSDSPEAAPTEAVKLATEPPKTETEITEEIQTIAAEVSEAPQDKVEAPAETVASVKVEIEAQNGSGEEVDITAAPTDDADATATSSDSTVAPALETPVKEAPVQEVTALAQVESENNSSQPESETQTKQKQNVEMIANEKEMIQTEELALNDTSEVTHEETGLSDTGDISLQDSSSTEPASCILGQSNESDVIEKSVAEVTAEEPIVEQTAEVEDRRSEDTHSEMAEQKQVPSEVSQTQEHSEEATSPDVDITNGLSSALENDLVKDTGSHTVENETNADVLAVEKLPQIEDIVQKLNEETLETETQEQLSSKPSTQIDR